jgi:hypothetical protein
MRAALRASRLALIAVAALFGLTGVQKSLTNHVPFGPATLVEAWGHTRAMEGITKNDLPSGVCSTYFTPDVCTGAS